MGLMSSRERFNKLKEKIVEKNEKEEENSSTENKFILKMKKFKKYRFRLLYWVDEDSTQESPFKKTFTHFIQDLNGNWKGISCPKTQMIKSGSKKCPICKNNGKLWNSGVESDKELYRKYKAFFAGYALVWVLNDPVTPENNNSVRILKIGQGINDWLEKQIFGIVKSWKTQYDDETDDDEQIGFDAFDIEKGFDLIIDVTERGEWAKYTPSFSRKRTSINMSEKDLEPLIKEVNIESIIGEESTGEELQNFFNSNILGISENYNKSSDDKITNIEIKESETKDEKINENKTTEIKVEESSSDSIEDEEIANLLKDIEMDD